jgi:hypothetical protein
MPRQSADPAQPVAPAKQTRIVMMIPPYPLACEFWSFLYEDLEKLYMI